MTVTSDPVEFDSDGATLRGFLMRPIGTTGTAERLPTIVMAHGVSATVFMVADRYAEAFVNADFCVLLYDHLGFGRSDGEPRRDVNNAVQCRGYLHAMNYVQQRPGVDPSRIGLWGDSISGGQVIAVGAIDARPKAIVAQVPAFGAQMPAYEATAANFHALRDLILDPRAAREIGTRLGPMSVVSADPEATTSLLKPIQAFKWFIEYGGRPGSLWQNRITFTIPKSSVPYHAAGFAPFVRAAVQLVVSPSDEIEASNPVVVRRAFESMPGHKEWQEVEGGHFGLLYDDSDIFRRATQVQADFFSRMLLH